MMVPARSESTTPTPGVQNAPMNWSSSMKGTFSFTNAGLTSSDSIPQAFALDMRRRSSSMRSSVRAISKPPDCVKTPISWYCATESSVRSVISREWSTVKMKLDAWPVDPPGLGSAPLSICTTSVHPSRVRWCTRLLPTMPAPITTTPAVVGTSAMTGLLGASPAAGCASRNGLRHTRLHEMYAAAPEHCQGCSGRRRTAVRGRRVGPQAFASSSGVLVTSSGSAPSAARATEWFSTESYFWACSTALRTREGSVDS